jgi:hypothetical protein
VEMLALISGVFCAGLINLIGVVADVRRQSIYGDLLNSST